MGTKAHLMTASLALMLALPTTSLSAELPYRGDGHLIVQPNDLTWSDVPSMAPPAKIAVIEGDPSQAEPFTMRLKLPAGYRLEPHRHPAVERVTVLSGTLYFAQGEQFNRDQAKPIPPGGFAVMPQGTAMYGYTEEDTVLQLHGTGPWGIEYVNPEDDPRN